MHDCGPDGSYLEGKTALRGVHFVIRAATQIQIGLGAGIAQWLERRTRD